MVNAHAQRVMARPQYFRERTIHLHHSAIYVYCNSAVEPLITAIPQQQPSALYIALPIKLLYTFKPQPSPYNSHFPTVAAIEGFHGTPTHVIASVAQGFEGV